MTQQITLALSKGRIFEETLPLLAAAGIEVLEDPEKSRKLILPTSRPEVRVVLVRATDVRPTCNTAAPIWVWPARTRSSSTAARGCSVRWI